MSESQESDIQRSFRIAHEHDKVVKLVEISWWRRMLIEIRWWLRKKLRLPLRFKWWEVQPLMRSRRIPLRFVPQKDLRLMIGPKARAKGSFIIEGITDPTKPNVVNENGMVVTEECLSKAADDFYNSSNGGENG
jgi:hypothetical protein